MTYEEIKHKAEAVKRLEQIEKDLSALEELAERAAGGDLSDMKIAFGYSYSGEAGDDVVQTRRRAGLLSYVVFGDDDEDDDGRHRGQRSIALDEYAFLRTLDALWKGMIDERDKLIEAIT